MNKNKKILFVTQSYAPNIGGLATSGTRIANTLAQLGHEVHVLAFTGDIDAGEVETERSPNGAAVHRFGRSKQVDFTQQQALIFLEWLHREVQFDLVWSHYAWQNGFMGIWFAEQFEIPSVVAVRGNDLDRQLFPPGDLSRLRWMLERATEIVSVSADLASKIETLVDRQATVLHNSVDGELFGFERDQTVVDQLKANLGIQAHEMVLAFCGELRAKKGVPALVECFETVATSRPTKLLIIGDIRKQDRSPFERMLAAADLTIEQIVVTGHLPEQADIAAHLRLGDIFLLPSLWDGLPNSLLEAMAVGLPVIASDAGAIGEVLIHNENGIVVPRSHLHQFAHRIDQFFSRPAKERDAMIVRARATVEQNTRPNLNKLVWPKSSNALRKDERLKSRRDGCQPNGTQFRVALLHTGSSAAPYWLPALLHTGSPLPKNTQLILHFAENK